MNRAGLSLLFLVMTCPLPAQSGEGPLLPRTSNRIAREIRAGLPLYSPPAAAGPATPATERTPLDPDVFELPKMMVKERRIPTNDPDVWLADRLIQRKAMIAYKDSMTPLEWAMNCWFVPLFSAPPSVRARAAYENNKRIEQYGQFSHLATVAKLADPKAAAQLQKAVTDMRHTDDWQNRPAGN